MANTGRILLWSESIYAIPKFLSFVEIAHVHYRLIVVLSEYVSMISPGLHEGSYRFVCSRTTDIEWTSQ
jgi:hypothetical protein